MQRVTDLDTYLRDPRGRWYSGETWLHFCLTEPELAGVVIWDKVSLPMAEPILACATAALERLPPEHAVIIDGRRVRSIDTVCYAMCSDWVIRNRKLLGERVTTLAGLRPLGFVGAIAEGFWRMVPNPYPVQLFSERGEGLRWLGCEEHAATIEEIDRLASDATRSTSILGDLHRVIEQHPHDGTLDSSARALATSVRSLQRRLRSEGTTFQRELSAVRVRLAQRMMLESEATLSRIASDTGFASAATFSVVFRKHTGKSPSEWREKRGDGNVDAERDTG